MQIDAHFQIENFNTDKLSAGHDFHKTACLPIGLQANRADIVDSSLKK